MAEEAETVEPQNVGPPRRGISNISAPESYSSIWGTTSNLVNSIVGAGIIGIPYAFRESGLVAGLFALALVAWLTDKSLRVLVESACYHPKLKNLGVLTYEDLISIPFGRIGTLFVLVNMFILAYGAMVAYLLIIKDTVPHVLGIAGEGLSGFVERELVMVLVSIGIILPLAMMRDMASLSFTSLLSVVADVLLLIFIAVFSPMKSTVSEAGGLPTVITDNVVNSHLFIGLGIISTAMACQHSAFIVSGSLENKSSERWSIVTRQSITIAAIMCAILGTTGFLGFLDETKGDILNNFDPDSVAADGARGLLAITMIFTYPMESFVARHVLVRLFFNGDIDGHAVDENGNITPGPKILGLASRKEALTLAIYLMTLFPALIVNDIGPVLSITGSLGGSCLSYIGPGLVYLGIHGESFLQYSRSLCSSKSAHTASPDIELPVVGDSNATMQTPSEQVQTTGSKPWYWFLLGFPIWTAIASAGSLGMKARLAKIEQDMPGSTTESPRGEVIGPSNKDYYIAMFFIAFGAVAALVGFLSNLYVQANNIFFSPH